MTESERSDLQAQLVDLKRQRKKRADSSSPHTAAIAMIDGLIGEIEERMRADPVT